LISPGSVGSSWHTAGILLLLAFIGVSALIGSVIAEKTERRQFLFLWLILGILTTVPILYFRGNEFLLIWGIIGGISIGLGFPSVQAYLANSTTPDERGRVSGIAIFVTFVFIIASFLLVRFFGEEAASKILFLTLVLRSIGFVSLKLDAVKKAKNKAKSWRVTIGYQDFNRYLLAFVLFMIAAGLVSLLWNAVPATGEFNAAYQTASILRYVGLTVFALTTGLLADRIGRKKPIIIGLVMLGAAYAVVGLLLTPATFFVNLLLSGFAWGIIMVVYLVVPGDLSFPGSEERFYAVGWVLPLILYVGVQAVANVVGLSLNYVGIFSTILTIVLFGAILPLLYSVETLSESKMRERRLKEYAEKVGKLVEESQETV
jgi:MFS family permease